MVRHALLDAMSLRVEHRVVESIPKLVEASPNLIEASLKMAEWSHSWSKRAQLGRSRAHIRPDRNNLAEAIWNLAELSSNMAEPSQAWHNRPNIEQQPARSAGRNCFQYGRIAANARQSLKWLRSFRQHSTTALAIFVSPCLTWTRAMVRRLARSGQTLPWKSGGGLGGGGVRPPRRLAKARDRRHFRAQVVRILGRKWTPHGSDVDMNWCSPLELRRGRWCQGSRAGLAEHSGSQPSVCSLLSMPRAK